MPSPSRPTITVEVAFGAAYDVLSPTWTDVTSYVDWSEPITIKRGRSSEIEHAEPNQLTLTLKNSDGRFTPGLSSGPYYPNVTKGAHIRVRATWNSVTYDRFRGYVDEWAVVWPNDSSFDATVIVRATSVLSRLGRAATLRSVVEEEFLYDDPVGYWPMGDPEGSTTAHELTTRASDLVVTQQGGSGGTLEFGTATGPPVDDLTAPTFTPASATNGKYLAADVSVNAAGTATGITVECCFNAGTATYDRSLIELWAPDYLAGDNVFVGMWLRLMSDGTLNLGVTLPDTLGGYTTGTAINTVSTFDDNTTYYVMASLEELSATSVRLRIVFRNTEGAFTTTGDFTAELPVNLTRINVGGIGSPGGGELFSGVISHVAVHEVALDFTRRTIHAVMAFTGYDGTVSGSRFMHYARYAGVENLVVNIAGTGDASSFIDTTGKTALEAMRLLEATEQGVLSDGPDGLLSLTLRTDRYNLPSSATLDASTQDVGSLEPTLDDFGLVNDVTATLPGIADQRWIDEASIAAYGPYTETIETLADTANQALAIAQWAVSLRAEPDLRYPTATVDLMSEQEVAQVASILSLNPGHRITLSNLPSQAPASSIEVHVEGLTEDIRYDAWAITFNLSPGLPTVWELDDATYSVLGTTTRLAL